MEKAEKYADLRHNRFLYQLYAAFILGGIVFLVFAVWGLFPLRNSKSEDVAKRFILNNKALKSEVGEINKLSGFGLGSDKISRSEEIAGRLKTETEWNIEKARDEINRQPEIRKMNDDYGVWKAGQVVGTSKTIDVEIYLKYGYFGDYHLKYYIVAEAKYRDKGREWKNLPIGWFENYFLLFK